MCIKISRIAHLRRLLFFLNKKVETKDYKLNAQIDLYETHTHTLKHGYVYGVNIKVVSIEEVHLHLANGS